MDISKNYKGEKWEEKWKKPEYGWIKVNCDGAFSAKVDERVKCDAGIRVILRDDEGKVVSRTIVRLM